MKVLREHARKSRPHRPLRRRIKFWECHRTSCTARSFPRVWTDLRRTDRLCDGVLESNDGKFYRVHRVIMVAASEYFRAVFTSPLAISGSHVKLPFPSSVVDCIVDYSYTGWCHVGSDNVESLLPAADQIGVMGIVDLCAQYFKTQICTTNCWGIHNFCRSYFVYEIARETRQFMLINFADFIKQSYEFTKIPLEDTMSILRDDYLNAASEEIVFHAIDKWIMHDQNGRQVYATQLFTCARLGLLKLDFFKKIVMTAPYINEVCPVLLQNVHMSICERRKTIGLHERHITQFTKPRVPYEILFAVGGWSAGAPTNCIETYDVRADKWFLTKQFDQVPRSYHGLVSVDNLIYMIGGFDGANHFNSVRCHSPLTKTWIEKACMHQARCYVCCVTLGKDIYAIGGFNGRLRMNSAEKYSIATNQWTLINPMNRHRSDGGAAVVGSRIFVVGGFNGQEVLHSAEVYNSETGQWSMLPPMRSPRSGVSLVFYKGYLYAIGGFNGFSRLSTVERLNPAHPVEWFNDVPEMLTQRSNFACTVMNDMIYVVGGFNGSTTIAYTECYNGRQWTEVSSMNLNRSALAVCICKGLSNAADYTLLSNLRNNSYGNNSATGDGNATGYFLNSTDDPSEPVLEPYEEED